MSHFLNSNNSYYRLAIEPVQRYEENHVFMVMVALVGGGWIGTTIESLDDMSSILKDDEIERYGPLPSKEALREHIEEEYHKYVISSEHFN